MLILLRSSWPFFFRSSIFHLVHGFNKLVVVQHVHQLIDRPSAVARARLDVALQYVLSLLDRGCDALVWLHTLTPNNEKQNAVERALFLRPGAAFARP
jgi:hypothetical protein